jgi:hypothetical protein
MQIYRGQASTFDNIVIVENRACSALKKLRRLKS